MTFTALCSCNSSSTNKTEAIRTDSLVSDTTSISNQTNNSTTFTEEGEVDTITTIKFNELSISISRLIIYDEDKKIDQIQKDTVEVYVELGETIEGQIISV